MTHAPVALIECPNCQRLLDGEYCARCGQKVAPLNPSLHDFIHDLTHELLHVDGKIFRSVRYLLTRPGFLTREYFEGRRARYVSPIRLYLIFSVIFFALSAIPAGNGDPLSERDRAEIAAASRPGGRLDRFRSLSPDEMAARLERAQKEWFPRVMFVLVPVCALLVAIVTRATGRNYPQHLYFALHVHAAVFAALALSPLADLAHVRVLSAVVAVAVTLYWVWYPIVAFRSAYGGSWPLALGRAVFVAATYAITVGAVFALVVVVVLGQ
jgi:Protein of unknown function (DUF3667)